MKQQEVELARRMSNEEQIDFQLDIKDHNNIEALGFQLATHISTQKKI